MFENKNNLNKKFTENRIWYHWARKKYAGNQKHTFHIVTRSPWPIYSSIGALTLTVGMAMYMHNYMLGGFVVFQSIVLLSIVLFLWWRDVVREGNLGGYHTQKVQQGLRYGMILFIVSEIMFFFSFFWAFFHSSLSPSIALGSVWPPIGINVLDPLQIPLLNTFILLLSGLTVTWSHNVLREEDWQEDFFVKTCGFDDWLKLSDKKIEEFEDNFYQCAFALLLTIFLGFVFTLWQGYEYYKATFYINDGIYGSVFYMTTGLHGLHVIIGTIFLVVCFFRLIKFHYSWNSHFGFEAAIWYWHFVDVVWIFVFLSIYCWGSGLKMFK